MKNEPQTRPVVALNKTTLDGSFQDVLNMATNGKWEAKLNNLYVT